MVMCYSCKLDKRVRFPHLAPFREISLVVEYDIANVDTGVRFPHLAPIFKCRVT